MIVSLLAKFIGSYSVTNQMIPFALVLTMILLIVNGARYNACSKEQGNQDCIFYYIDDGVSSWLF